MPTRLITSLEKGLFAVAGVLLLGSVSLAFYAVVLRYGFNDSEEWIEEGARYLALTSALLAVGPVLRARGHVALDIVPNMLNSRRSQFHRIAVGIVGGFIGTGICFWGTQLAVRTYGFGMKTGSLQFPLWLPYSIIPLGMAFFVLFCVIEICEATVALRSDRTDTATVAGGIPDIDETGGDR